MAKCKEPLVRRYWEQLFDKQGNLGNSDYLAYFTSKISHLIDDRTLRVVLSQKKGLDVSKLVKEGCVLLCDLSRGKIGELNSSLLGMILLHLLEREILRRAQVTVAPERLEKDRPLFNIYVDEFHEFVTRDLTHILSTARKYNVGMTLTNQHPEQIGERCLGSVLANVGSFIVLRQGLSGADLLSELVQPRFSSQDLLSLPDFEAVVKITSLGSFNPPRRIVLSPKPRTIETDNCRRLRSKSSRKYGQKRGHVEYELLNRFASSESRSEPNGKYASNSTTGESEN